MFQGTLLDAEGREGAEREVGVVAGRIREEALNLTPMKPFSLQKDTEGSLLPGVVSIPTSLIFK